MPIQDRLPGVPAPAPSTSLAGHFRDRLAVRCRKADVLFPKALDLEAQALEVLHAELHGAATALSGTHTGDNFRERLRGEKPFLLADVCRLATDPTREARAAVGALVVLLSARSSQRPPTGSIASCAGDAAQAATSLLALVAKAQEDGEIDDAEREELRRAVTPLARAAGAVEQLLAGECR